MKKWLIFGLFVFGLSSAFSGTEGSISGLVVDGDGVSLPNAKVQLRGPNEKIIKEGKTSTTGTFQFFPIDFGDYIVVIEASGYSPYRTNVQVAAGGNSSVEAQLARSGPNAPVVGKEMVVTVRAKKRVQTPAPTSSVEITKEKIAELPQGEAITLPKLITTTSPGVVQGPFGQMFIRGNHANIQYQIDGVQLPDSPSNTFGEAFSPRNIDHMELITGGIPAEYGQRLGAVMNIISKTGPETPSGSAELNYGSYHTFSPLGSFGGSLGDGSLHYFLSGNYRQTDRGLDTPQPASLTDQTQGGADAVHDQSHANNEFAKFDWILDNTNKFTLVGFHAFSFYQIPNSPASFSSDLNNSVFGDNFQDRWGNGPYNYVPSTTNDTQTERNAYLQTAWKHTFSERSFLQVAPYWKFSSILVTNDPANDLAAASIPALTKQSPSSFSEDRQTNNFGLKTDYTLRADDEHLVKTGFQLQSSKSTGGFTILLPGKTPFTDNSPDTGYFEGVYVQDDYIILKPLILNAGLRFDATQFNFADASTSDSALQPRIGLTWLATDTTKLHVFYGRLFQPAPIENLRAAFTNVGGGQLTPYDIKAEKDNYYEVGISQATPGDQVVWVNAYYKDAANQLDDAQLLNTSIAQPYNFAQGFAYGVEGSIQGHITEDLTDYINYTYEIAEGKGISGGIFIFPAGQQPGNGYQFLDHVQVHTLNAGLTYHWKNFSGDRPNPFRKRVENGK